MAAPDNITVKIESSDDDVEEIQILAGSSQGKSSEGDHPDPLQLDFNYTETKKEYMSLLNNIFNHKINHVDPWTAYSYKKILSQAMFSRSPEVLKYEVIVNDMVQSLVLSGTTTEVLTYENCFDVFVDAHIHATNHGGYQEMKNLLNGYYVYEKKCLHNFLRSCTSCKELYKPKEEEYIEINKSKFNQLVQLDYKDMRSIPGKFKFIMTYTDKATNFVLVRPLLTCDSECIAMELLKIFVDFGPPKEIYTMNIQKTYKAIEIVQATLQFKCSIRDTDSHSDITNQVYSKIHSWALENNCSNWGYSCWLIQHQMNTEGKNNPMKKIFGRCTPSLVLEKLVDKAGGAEDLSSDEEDVAKKNKQYVNDKVPKTKKLHCGQCKAIMYGPGSDCFSCKMTCHGCCGVRIKNDKSDSSYFYCTKCQNYKLRHEGKVSV
ncbi:uncharacterized protein LOC126976368 [Leptidea sinapis]|uniref:uncharacterized protein LOC126976368 n=1 Tax=Leptidea sinapis TaxID=189913 RepID=UPI0021347CC8|nr:uncharacterized protein LOC126976368 [Leptidea sinapis]